jgi:hypothetical protein
LEGAHGVIPAAAPAIGHLEAALNNLALAGMNDTAVLHGGMAKVVYRDTNDLCKSNYYFALSTPSSCNPTNLPPSHTGIADSGASGINFASNALVANLNPKAPSVGVHMANGLPVQPVASATLASAPSLPPAAMKGHFMPSFPHTLIRLGPFADLGCQIVFSKHAVLVIHPDGHSILDGWCEQNGPRLWRFPLKATMPIARQRQKRSMCVNKS